MEADLPDPLPASPPDPPQDQPGKTTPVPEYIAALLYAVDMLLGYGRHLFATIRHRAAAPTFPTIAAAFGTSNLSTILAHLNRGILRAPSPRSVAISPSYLASAPAPSGTGCSSSCITSAAMLSP